MIQLEQMGLDKTEENTLQVLREINYQISYLVDIVTDLYIVQHTSTRVIDDVRDSTTIVIGEIIRYEILHL